MVLYNLFILISTKSLAYLYYVLYVFSYGVFLFTIQGFSPRFLATESTWISGNGAAFFNGIAGICLALFSIHFLRLDDDTPRLKKGMQMIILASSIQILFSFFLPYSFVIKYLMGSSLIGFLFLFYCGVYRVKMNYRPAKYYLLAFSFMMAGAVITIFTALGILPTHFLTVQAMSIGNALELILLSMGLADRFNLMQEVALAKEKVLTDLLEEARDGLEKKVAEKTHNVNNLVENLEQGFMILDKKGLIQKGATKASMTLFEVDPAGKKMADVLRLTLLEKEHFGRWMKHVFRGQVPFKDLLSLAPKVFNKIEGRMVSLDYRPIISEKKIKQIICIATDITDRVKFERVAETEKEKAQRLGSILDHPLEFMDLMSDSEETIHHFLKNLSRSNPEDLFRSFHTLKARFGVFKLTEIVDGIHELESFLNEIEDDWSDKNKSHSHGLIEKINHVRTQFVKDNRRLIELSNTAVNQEGGGNITALIKDIQTAFTSFNKRFILKELSTLFNAFISPTKELAKQQDKLISISIKESDIFINPLNYKDLFSSLLHVFRNSVDHGIEAREERVAKNKSETATLKISFKKEDEKSFQIKIQDDGKGIDSKVISAVASKKKQFSHLNLAEMSEKDIISLIFEPGFSSKEEATTISGRGVGMDAVKTEVEKLGGEVRVQSIVDEGTTFIFKLPDLQ
jgi:signal transduction histidine kinase